MLQENKMNDGEWQVKTGPLWQQHVLESVFAQVRDVLDPDPKREGVEETPMRVAKAWMHWTGGYRIDPLELLKTFSDGSEDYDEMVYVKDIPFYSHCEHHFAPFFGTATIAYIPKSRIVGISKLARILDAYSRRFQVQERLTTQIATCLEQALDPVGIGVMVKARHMCMESRGVCLQGHHTVTTCLRGEIRNDRDARHEFLLLAK